MVVKPSLLCEMVVEIREQQYATICCSVLALVVMCYLVLFIVLLLLCVSLWVKTRESHVTIRII